MLKTVPVVGVTCCSSTLPVFDDLRFDVVVLDEASQMIEPVSLLPLLVSVDAVLVSVCSVLLSRQIQDLCLPIFCLTLPSPTAQRCLPTPSPPTPPSLPTLRRLSSVPTPLPPSPAQRSGCKFVIMAGDPCQLGPVIASPATLSVKGGPGEASLCRPMFVRLVEAGHAPYLLRAQYRCHPAISAVPNRREGERALRWMARP